MVAVGVLPTLFLLTLSLYVAFSSSWQSVSGLVTAKFCAHLPSSHTHAYLPMQEPKALIRQSVEHDMQGHLKQQISWNTLRVIEIEGIQHLLECFAR